MDERLRKIRESEAKSHTEMYSNTQLYQGNGWMKKPIRTVQELIPLFDEYQELRVLDLGCGVGRNCLEIASKYKHIDCRIDGVDILPLAIEKLDENAEGLGVSENIFGIVASIEEFTIPSDTYDFILAVSALEHVDTKESFLEKLLEIREGIREKGVVCLIVNSNVREYDKNTNEQMDAQFEVNMSSEEMEKTLSSVFKEWTVIKSTIREQQYDIPREWGISNLKTSVVTFAARK